MIMPHTVTIYNVSHETDPETFDDVTTNYITVLAGVFLDESKGANVIRSGLESADAVALHIPFGVNAVDGITGAGKTFVSPMEFWRAEDKTSLWTLSTDRNTFFVKGAVIEDESEEYINLMHDGVYTVTKVDEKDFGLPDMRHWEVGGK